MARYHCEREFCDLYRIELLEEENRWLKAQLFARSSEKTPIEERHPDQGTAIQRGRSFRAGSRTGADQRHDACA